MHALRTSSFFARLVLVWFALTVLAAGASPLVHPKAMELVCSADGGIKLVASEDGADATHGNAHTLDCAMCLPVHVPPAPVQMSATPPSPLAHALKPVVAAHIAGWAGAPLPPRGPPRV